MKPFNLMLIIMFGIMILSRINPIFMVSSMYFMMLGDTIMTNISLNILYKKKGNKAFDHELNPLGRSLYKKYGIKTGFLLTFLLAFIVISIVSVNIFQKKEYDVFFFLTGMYFAVNLIHIKNLTKFKDGK